MHPNDGYLPPWVVLHLPHVSTFVPAAHRKELLVDDEQLAREHALLVDHHALELFLDGRCTVPHVRANASRLVVDVERFWDDDKEPAAQVGFGAVYKKTTRGTALRGDFVRTDPLLERHNQHHARLAAAIGETLEDHGRCLVVDCHTFPDTVLPFEGLGAAAEGTAGAAARTQGPRKRPDICIGTDPHHTPKEVTQAFVDAFAAEGWSVDVDHPFSGALVPEPFHGEDDGVWAVMVEVNRRICRDASGPVDGPDHPVAQRVRACLARALERVVAVLGDAPRAGESPRQKQLPEDECTWFVVDGSDTAKVPGMPMPQTRLDHYGSDVDGCTKSAQDCAALAERFEPLQWALRKPYEEARFELLDAVEELESEVADLEEAAADGEVVDAAELASLRERLAVLQPRLDAMPEDPSRGVLCWLHELDDATFARDVVPTLEEWLGDAPGCGEEDYCFNATENPYRSALEQMESELDDDVVRRLRIRLVDGESPSSTYVGAELTLGLDATNQAAYDLGEPVRFLPDERQLGEGEDSGVGADTLRAYHETVYVTFGSRAVQLRIGEANAGLAALYRLWGVESCAFVTAFNPLGKAGSAKDNARRNEKLRRELERLRLPHFDGHGAHSTNGWPPEPSFLVLGAGFELAQELGSDWGQDAVVWAGADAVPRLVLLR